MANGTGRVNIVTCFRRLCFRKQIYLWTKETYIMPISKYVYEYIYIYIGFNKVDYIFKQIGLSAFIESLAVGKKKSIPISQP